MCSVIVYSIFSMVALQEVIFEIRMGKGMGWVGGEGGGLCVVTAVR